MTGTGAIQYRGAIHPGTPCPSCNATDWRPGAACGDGWRNVWCGACGDGFCERTPESIERIRASWTDADGRCGMCMQIVAPEPLVFPHCSGCQTPGKG